jgi:hypothetical protein
LPGSQSVEKPHRAVLVGLRRRTSPNRATGGDPGLLLLTSRPLQARHRLFLLECKPKASQNKQTEISKIVKNILENKEINPDADTSGLEKEVDQLVYQLYELTEEEIKIVEE